MEISWLPAIAGFVLITAAMIDAIWTTLTTGGGGPLTARLTEGIWRLTTMVVGRSSIQKHRLLIGMGTVMLLIIMTVWIIMVWVGWSLLFSSGAESIVNGQTREPADLASLIYYTGYTLFTLGVGNYVPNSGLWELLTALASLNGMILITLSITYLVPVLSAATQKRQLAATTNTLGESPTEILTRSWTNGANRFEALSNHLIQLVPMIELYGQRHAAYPILHYFHSPSRRTAVSPNLAALDEALLIMTRAVAPEVRLSEAVVRPAREALDELLAALNEQYIHTYVDPPPAPDLKPLRKAGIPLVDEASFLRAVDERAEHRRMLRAFVENDGWLWDDVLEKDVPPEASRAKTS